MAPSKRLLKLFFEACERKFGPLAGLGPVAIYSLGDDAVMPTVCARAKKNTRFVGIIQYMPTGKPKACGKKNMIF